MLLTAIIILGACTEEGGTASDFGNVIVKFDNAVEGQTARLLSEPGDESYTFTNGMGQAFNLTLIKYIVSEMVLEGPDGAYYAQPLEITADEVLGYYLIDEGDQLSQRIVLSDIPEGIYNKLSYKIGISEEGVEQGASIILTGMFWSWNSGYIGMKIEGQSPESLGEAFGDTIEETNPFGFAYHIGGWNTPNNIRSITLDIEEMMVSSGYQPEIHVIADITGFMDGIEKVDFSKQNSVHDPSAGQKYADNLLNSFVFDHLHNNPL